MLHEFATVTMDTFVHVAIDDDRSREELQPLVDRALGWFEIVERICSRFDPTTEVMQLSRVIGKPVTVSTLLLELVDFALQLARLTDGAFDPTLGAELEERGYAIEYRTGRRVVSSVAARGATFRDVRVDRKASTITLREPVVLDLNSVAKGLAIDLAAHELRELSNFSIEAGGDLYTRGRRRVGIQDPLHNGLLEQTLDVADAAVCTSGTYERGDHLLDGRTHEPVPNALASVTVVAPTALAADGFSTVAMVLGSDRATQVLKQQGLKGLLVTSNGEVLQCA